jgi:hypothetical protein
LKPNRNPYIFSTAVVADEAVPPPLKGEESVSAELATKGIDAEDAQKSLGQAVSWSLLNKVLSTLRTKQKPHR